MPTISKQLIFGALLATAAATSAGASIPDGEGQSLDGLGTWGTVAIIEEHCPESDRDRCRTLPGWVSTAAPEAIGDGTSFRQAIVEGGCTEWPPRPWPRPWEVAANGQHQVSCTAESGPQGNSGSCSYSYTW